MESSLQVIFQVLLAFSFLNAQASSQSDVCMAITECFTTSDMESVLRNKHTSDICGKFREGLKCTNLRADECLKSLPEDSPYREHFTNQRDMMAQTYQTKCGGEEKDLEAVTACSQNDLTTCMSGLPKDSPQGEKAFEACEKMKEAIECLKAKKATCTNDKMKAAFTQTIQAYKMSADACDSMTGGKGSGGCNLQEITKCMPKNLKDQDSLKTKCKKMPQVMECLAPHKEKCKDNANAAPMFSQMESEYETAKTQCKEKGITMGEGGKQKADGGNGSGSFSPSTLLIMGASVLMAAHFHL